MHQISKIYFVVKLYMFPSSVKLKRGSNLTLLGSGDITCMKRTNCRAYSG